MNHALLDRCDFFFAESLVFDDDFVMSPNSFVVIFAMTDEVVPGSVQGQSFFDRL